MLAGFPCQAFSVAGYRQGFNDEKGRGNLFFELARIIEEKKPQVVFLENVKNLVSHDNGNTFAVISDTLEKLGYYIKPFVLNACNYGNIPQTRERIYIVCFRNKEHYKNFEHLKPIKLEKTLAFLALLWYYIRAINGLLGQLRPFSLRERGERHERRHPS